MRWRASPRSDRESLPYAVLGQNHEFAISVCEYGEGPMHKIMLLAWYELIHPWAWSGCIESLARLGF